MSSDLAIALVPMPLYDTVDMFSILGKICDKLGISFSYSRDNSPLNKATFRDSPIGTFQQAGGDINNTTIFEQAPRNPARPDLDVIELGGDGGADGTFVSFKVQNDGDEAARDVRIELVADDFNGGQKFEMTNLSPHKQSAIRYRYDDTDLFKRQLKNPRIVLTYNSSDNRSFESGRTIVQEARADGRWNIHTKQGSHFESVLDKGLEIEIER